VLASACLTEESVEGIVSTTDGLVRRHLSIWLYAMFEAKELPARIANLHAGLANVDAKSFTHGCDVKSREIGEVEGLQDDKGSTSTHVS
jgi:hypothetical protein